MYFHITVTVCIQGGCSPLSAKYCTNSSESASPSHLLAHFTNHLPRAPPLVSILVLPSPQKAVRSQPCYDSRSSCKQTWVQMTEPQLPLSSTVGKMKVHKVAQLPCHNLGRAGIAAEVVCAAPQREGVPAITHQEVPNQLRRDADRLWCTFLFFFFLLLLKSSKENAGPQHQWTRTSFPNSYEGNYTRKQKKLSPWTVCESLSLARAHPTVLVHRWLQSYQIWVKLVKQNHFPRTKWHSTVNSSFL